MIKMFKKLIARIRLVLTGKIILKGDPKVSYKDAFGLDSEKQ